MPKIRLRVTAFIAVLALHAAALIVLATMHVALTAKREDETAFVYLMLPSSLADEPSGEAQDHVAASAPRRVPRHDTHDNHKDSEPALQTQSSAPVAIDWAEEAARAVARRIDEDEEAARRAGAFSAPKSSRDAPQFGGPAKPAFHWGTPRVELIPAGAIFHLNDHCVLVVSILIIPACQLGEIKARGDLLEHMNDLKPLGAGTDDPP